MSKDKRVKNGRNPATNLALPLANNGIWVIGGDRPAGSWLMLVGGAGVPTKLGKPCGTPGGLRITAQHPPGQAFHGR